MPHACAWGRSNRHTERRRNFFAVAAAEHQFGAVFEQGDLLVIVDRYVEFFDAVEIDHRRTVAAREFLRGEPLFQVVERFANQIFGFAKLALALAHWKAYLAAGRSQNGLSVGASNRGITPHTKRAQCVAARFTTRMGNAKERRSGLERVRCRWAFDLQRRDGLNSAIPTSADGQIINGGSAIVMMLV